MERAGFVDLAGDSVTLVVLCLSRAEIAAVLAAADAMDVDRARMARAVWQAPSALLSGLDIFTANRWHRTLSDLGLEVALVPSDAPVPTRSGRLLDVAICHRTMAGRGRLAQDLARFLGLDPAEVAAELHAAPGWVVPRISAANVASLRRRFGHGGVAVRVSDPQTTGFDLDTRAMTRPAREALERALAMVGATMAGTLPSYLARSLSDSFAGHGLRLIDRAFRNHAVRLTAPPGTARAWAGLRALSGRDGPHRTRGSWRGPAVLDRGLDWYEAPEAAAAYRAAGLVVDVVAEPLGPHIPQRSGF